MLFGPNKRKKKHSQTDGAVAPPGDARIEADVEAARETGQAEAEAPARNYWNAGVTVHDWVSEIFREEWKKGAFDDLAGKGKPIEVPSGDVTNSLLRQSNFLPGWLTLQHEIRDRLRLWLQRTGSDGDPALERDLREINAMIVRYNTMVPHAALQKPTVTKENASRQLGHWE
nr:DnaJ family domain-containing protein [Paenibacillus artemisiicola]